jgi:hypothetical protein
MASLIHADNRLQSCFLDHVVRAHLSPTSISTSHSHIFAAGYGEKMLLAQQYIPRELPAAAVAASSRHHRSRELVDEFTTF